MKHLITILFALLAQAAIAQVNLVPNGSFEEYDMCPTDLAQLESSNSWQNPTTSSPDYFNTCSTFYNCSIPDNYLGFQYPHSGNAYAGLIIYSSITQNFREYIQVKLTNELLHDTIYCVSFYYSFADEYFYALTNNVEAHFSTIPPENFNSAWPPPALQNIIPQVVNENAVNDTINWLLFSGVYKAQGGESYLTIGNFKLDTETSLITSPYNIGTDIYIYIDDVSVTQCDTILPIKIPNVFTPNSDQLNETFKIENLQPNSLLTVYSRWGNVVYSNPNYGNNWDGEMNSDGVYYYILQLPSGEIKKGTVTILRGE